MRKLTYFRTDPLKAILSLRFQTFRTSLLPMPSMKRLSRSIIQIDNSSTSTCDIFRGRWRWHEIYAHAHMHIFSARQYFHTIALIYVILLTPIKEIANYTACISNQSKSSQQFKSVTTYHVYFQSVTINKYDLLSNIHSRSSSSAHAGPGFFGWHRVFLLM